MARLLRFVSPSGSARRAPLGDTSSLLRQGGRSVSIKTGQHGGRGGEPTMNLNAAAVVGAVVVALALIGVLIFGSAIS